MKTRNWSIGWGWRWSLVSYTSPSGSLRFFSVGPMRIFGWKLD